MKKAELIKMIREEIVWFRNANKESDNFLDLLEAVLASNKSAFVKGVNSVMDDLFSGKKPNPNAFSSVVNEKLYKAYYEIGGKNRYRLPDYNTFVKLLVNKQAPRIFPKMLYKGVISDIVDGGTYVKKYATSSNKKALDDLSVQRGKEKFLTMLKNKGIV